MFLGDPCPCGWALDEELDESQSKIAAMVCVRCHRRYVRTVWGWDQVTPMGQVDKPNTCAHNRLWSDFGINENSCPHCEAEAVYLVMES